MAIHSQKNNVEQKAVFLCFMSTKNKLLRNFSELSNTINPTHHQEEIHMQRRQFVKSALTGGAVATLISLLPQSVLAAWPKEAFEAKDVSSALSALLGSSEIIESGKINIKAPDIAENGAVVPVQISTTLANVESITVIADQNPVPLVANFELTKHGAGYVSTRMKMGKTGNAVAVVKADGKLYQATKQVKVTIGGCGG